MAKPPSSMSRAFQTVRTTIKGVSEAWFGPMQPIAPQAQDAKGRTWDYPVAFNLNYIPRANMALSFADLRNLADNAGVLRSVIETRKDQIEALDWSIHAKKVDKKSVKTTPEMADRLKYITKIFMEPNKDIDWPQFVRQILEQHFVYDAPALEFVRNRGGDLCNIKVLDGSTIGVRLDANGGTPAPPYVAYQQVLKGLPAVDFTADELLYYPRNRRPGFAYGFPHVAQIYQYVNLSLKRISEQLAAYDSANAPHGVMEGGPSMTVDQITAMQNYWESMFNGSIPNRAKTWWVPSGSKYTPLAREILFDEFDEWLARVICYCFSISPTPFIKQNNRATAQASQDASQSEGTRPTMMYLKRMFDRIISKQFGSDDLEFVWDKEWETDPSKQADMTVKYVTNGVMTIDEAREDLGMDAFGGAAATPLALTGQGYVPVDPQERTDMSTDSQTAVAKANPKPAFGGMGPDGRPLPGPQKPAGAIGGPAGAKLPTKADLAAGAPKPPRPSSGTASVSVKGKPGTMAKVMTTEAVFEVSRPLINSEELSQWVKSIGLQPVDQLSLRFTALDEPGGGEPFMLADAGLYTSRIVKDADGFRLYFDCAPFVERADEVGATEPPSILLDDTTNTVVPDGAAFTGSLLFGPEEIAKRWDLGAFDVDLNPTPGQIDAGNYRKGHIQFQGLNLTIENPVGGARKGDDWQVLMADHYGYIKGTVGADGDHVDCFVGPNPEASMVYVIDQNDARKGGFDEHKVMLGFDTWTQARMAYQRAFTDGKHDVRIGNATMLSMDEFKKWLQTGDTTVPITMAKDVTMSTGLSYYDQLGTRPKPKAMRPRGQKGTKVGNSKVGVGPQEPAYHDDEPPHQPEWIAKGSRWMDY